VKYQKKSFPYSLLYFTLVNEDQLLNLWVIDCCFMPSEKNFSYVQLYEMMRMTA